MTTFNGFHIHHEPGADLDATPLLLLHARAATSATSCHSSA